MRWGIYARLSYVRTGRENQAEAGLERQEDACRALVLAKGGEVVEVYPDEGLSAYQPGVVRPAFERALADLEARHVEGLAAFKLDRLVRSHEDLSRLWEVVQRSGATLACVHDSVDTSSPQGEFVLRMTVGLARMESANLGLRVAAQREQLARQGRPGYGGTRPYGYQLDRVTVAEAEAQVLRDATGRLLEGESLRQVCRDLNAAGERTTTGKPWSPALLRQALSRPRVAGLREHRGVVVADATWPAVLDRTSWEELRALFANPGRRSQIGRPRLFLLVGGLGRCGAPGEQSIGPVEGICGKPLISGRRGDHRDRGGDGRRYLCAPRSNGGCGGVSIDRAALEDVALEAMATALAGPGVEKALAATAGSLDADLGDQLHRDQEKLKDLARMWARDAIGEPEYLEARAEIADRIRRTERRLATRAGRGPLAALPRGLTPEAMRSCLDELSLERQRAVADAILEAVVVRPGRVAANRAAFVWKT
jgi:DNA invertase Pin-like site-specific DNA recombinase